uniref:Uncharacterized protein n=1 Tax=Setaria digitata TaxID=48799 RepID=A0A915PM84_9BILA
MGSVRRKPNNESERKVRRSRDLRESKKWEATRQASGKLEPNEKSSRRKKREKVWRQSTRILKRKVKRNDKPSKSKKCEKVTQKDGSTFQHPINEASSIRTESALNLTIFDVQQAPEHNASLSRYRSGNHDTTVSSTSAPGIPSTAPRDPSNNGEQHPIQVDDQVAVVERDNQIPPVISHRQNTSGGFRTPLQSPRIQLKHYSRLLMAPKKRNSTRCYAVRIAEVGLL